MCKRLVVAGFAFFCVVFSATVVRFDHYREFPYHWLFSHVY